MVSLAEAYMEGHDDMPQSWRIDVVALELDANGKTSRIEHIENVTDWGM